MKETFLVQLIYVRQMHYFLLCDDHCGVAISFTMFQFHLLYMHVLLQSCTVVCESENKGFRVKYWWK
jgi:hypothetical protein